MKSAMPLTYTRVPIAALYLALSAALPARAQSVQGTDEFSRIDITEQYGQQLPMQRRVTTADGRSVALAKLLQNGKPTVFMLAYYECPMLCTQVLNGAAKTVEQVKWRPGADYNLVVLSFDPGETAEMAAEKRRNYLERIGMGDAPQAWRFLVADKATIEAVADAVGYKYWYDASQDQYAHPAAIMVLTAEGAVSRYFFGISYPPDDLKLALSEAADGKIGSTMDRLVNQALLSCYVYDPDANSYTVQAFAVMRIGGVLTMLALGTMLGGFWLYERRRRRREHS